MKTKETFRKYVSALPLFLSEEEYRERLEKLQADTYLVQKIQEYNAKVLSKEEFRREMQRTLDGSTQMLIKDLKEQYCRSTKL